jgi:hypothetical protein
VLRRAEGLNGAQRLCLLIRLLPIPPRESKYVGSAASRWDRRRRSRIGHHPHQGRPTLRGSKTADPAVLNEDGPIALARWVNRRVIFEDHHQRFAAKATTTTALAASRNPRNLARTPGVPAARRLPTRQHFRAGGRY